MNKFFDRYIHYFGLNNKYIDSFLLSMIICLSIVPYINGLGFYSDDWAWISSMIFTADQSIFGLFNSLPDFLN